MRKQSKGRIFQLMGQFPAIMSLRSRYSQISNSKIPPYPEIDIYVQRPDLELMLLKPTNVGFNGGGYVVGENGKRGRLEQVLIAVNKDDSFVDLIEEDDCEVKDTLGKVNLEQLSYLIWSSYYEWFTQPTEQAEHLGMNFGKMVGRELSVIVYPKLKGISWTELVETAGAIKKTRESAYKFNPPDMPPFSGIEKALNEGCRIYAFRSGGGLRVVSLMQKGESKAYGEHPHVEEALKHLNLDFLEGGRSYEEMYGGPNAIYPHYLTGSQLATSNIDYWVGKGGTFRCWKENGSVVFKLRGYEHNQMPDWVLEKAESLVPNKYIKCFVEKVGILLLTDFIRKVIKRGRKTEWNKYLIWVLRKAKGLLPNRYVRWKDRGFSYATIYYPEYFANGEPGYSTQVIGKSRSDSDSSFFEISKTGRGSSFWKAMLDAFSAEEEEVLKN